MIKISPMAPLVYASGVVCVFIFIFQVVSCGPTSEEMAVINLHNSARAGSGLPGLSFDMRLYNVSWKFCEIYLFQLFL